MAATGKNNRTVFRADIDELCKFAANANSGGLSKNCMTVAIELLRQCVYAQKGAERRILTDNEIIKLISKGYALTD